LGARAVGARWFVPAAFLACAAPWTWLAWQAAPVLIPAFYPDIVLPWDGDLGANPVETLLHTTGRYAVYVLLATLAITPIRRLTGWNRIQRVRRLVGVWAFVYALSHFTIYMVFDKLGDVREIVADVLERRFIFSGMFAFLLLAVLAATSTNWAIRALGKRWQRLHRLVYVAAIAAIVHFAWGQKAAIGEPLVWAGVLAVLLGSRVVLTLQKRAARQAAPVSR
jgi:methionine sulfoxide reductase heme-binding subunit